MPGQNQPRFRPNRNAVNVLKRIEEALRQLDMAQVDAVNFLLWAAKSLRKIVSFFLNCFQTKFVAIILALLVFLCFFSWIDVLRERSNFMSN